MGVRLDNLGYSTYGESIYGEDLRDLEYDGWRGRVDVDERALFVSRPLLRADLSS